MLDTHPRKLLVIISEGVLERQLIGEARALGALGYTVTDVRGGGIDVWFARYDAQGRRVGEEVRVSP